MQLKQGITSILHYFPLVNQQQKKQFINLAIYCVDWNQRINLVSRKDIHNLYIHHVLHSLSIANVVKFRAGARILDVGTGGGFPGIPLAIFFPQTHFTLIDSIAKKTHAVQDIVRKLSLNNVTVCCERAENVLGRYDFITARALTKLSTLYAWVQHKISDKHIHSIPNGILYLKGITNDHKTIPYTSYKRYAIARFFQEPFFATKEIFHLFKA